MIAESYFISNIQRETSESSELELPVKETLLVHAANVSYIKPYVKKDCSES